VSGIRYSFTHKSGDLVHHEVILPDGAPERFRDASVLWNEATRKEITKDRISRKVRFKRKAQVAKSIILALGKELNDAERLEVTRRFVRRNYTKYGVAVEFAIHRPSDESPDNHHAHLLVTTRKVNRNGFSAKARDLNPGFATNQKRRFVCDQDAISDRWADAQNAYFSELGLALQVDPKRQVRGIHVGPSWHSKSRDGQGIAAEIDGAAATEMQDPAAILRGITTQRATFSVRELQKYISKHGVTGADRDRAVDAVLAHPDIRPLVVPQSGTSANERFTTSQVRAQELRILEHAGAISCASTIPLTAATVALAASKFTLDSEQTEALERLARKRLSILIGRAGTGKSRTLNCLRTAYEASGYFVRALAPTHVVSAALSADGFASSSTVHRAMHRLNTGAERWDRRTVVVVDESGMIDSEMYDKLFAAIAASGASLVLAGDDRQLSSVSRGGMLTELAKRFGTTELRRVRRQAQDWQREASEQFARGNIAAGLLAYSTRGFVNWNPSIDDSRLRLMHDWSSLRDPGINKFIYASTNDEVNKLNALAHDFRVQNAEIVKGQRFETKRGCIELSVGDRLQFYSNDRKAGIVNGAVGTVQSVSSREIKVTTDAGLKLTFDPDTFRDWGHGYAGSTYRGQGQTKLRVFALYDNAYAWDAKATYVGMTRHQAELNLYVSRDRADNEAGLATAMSRVNLNAASINFEISKPEKDPFSERKRALALLRRKMGISDSADLAEWRTAVTAPRARRAGRLDGVANQGTPRPRR
jgi:Ti-type conjugative transfer relaxase TraA